MGNTLEAASYAAHVKLSTPDRAIVAVSRSIERDTEHSRLPGASLGEDRRDVCPVMLDGARVARREGERRLCGCVFGMRIVSDDDLAPFDRVHRHEVVDGLTEGPGAFGVIEIADVLAHEGLTPDDQGDRVFQVAADSQHRSV